MIDAKILNVFQKIYPELTNPGRKPINWAVTGSFGMVLHGMQMDIHDIDIQTDKEGAYEIERRLVRYLVKLVHFKASERIRSYFGAFEIVGIKIEVMGDMQHFLSDQQWDSPVRLESYRDWVDYADMHIPVMTLEHEAKAYQKMGRTAKAETIQNFLLKE
ncbi:MAG: nucleotidyltransferase domain-containing protein [Anaerolineaceae bacterium]